MSNVEKEEPALKSQEYTLDAGMPSEQSGAVQRKSGVVQSHQSKGSLTDQSRTSGGGDSVFRTLITQKKTFAVALFSAIGGFLFGLDIGYIGPILEMRSFRNQMNNGNAISSGDEALIVAVFGIGAIASTFPPINAFFDG
jgi:hypothetical protein